jgi:uncharacterized protein involved in exopolysaccharide biosynthesis
MRAVLEIVFSRPLRLLLLLILPPLIGVGVAFQLPRSYQATAYLLAEQQYEFIGGTGTQSDPNVTPAQSQVSALIELLQTPQFDLQVADQASLASTLSPAIRSDPQSRDDALINDVSHGTTAAAVGASIYTISYTNKVPYVAQQVVKAVIATFGQQIVQFSTTRGQKQLAEYQDQTTQAQQAVDEATSALQKYVATHPGSNLNTDAAYQALYVQFQQAQGNLAAINDKIATLQQQLGALGNSPDSLFTVVNQPALPDRALSRVKTLLLGGVAGLAVGLIACVLYVVLLARRNRTAYAPEDLRTITQVPVVLEISHLSSSTMTWAVTGSGRELLTQPAARRIRAVR